MARMLFDLSSLHQALCLDIDDDPDAGSTFTGQQLIEAFEALDLPDSWVQPFDVRHAMLGRGGEDPTKHFIVEAESDEIGVRGLNIESGSGSRLIDRKRTYWIVRLVYARSPIEMPPDVDVGGRGSPGIARMLPPQTPEAIVANLKDAAARLKAALDP